MYGATCPTTLSEGRPRLSSTTTSALVDRSMQTKSGRRTARPTSLVSRVGASDRVQRHLGGLH